jgi:hypothetical protein
MLPPAGLIVLAGIFTAATTASAQSRQPVVTVAVSPSSVQLASGARQQFTATISGTPTGAVTWSISPVSGSITPSGLYTAPASLSAAQYISVTAVSAASHAARASATVVVSASAAQQGVAFSTSANGLASLVFNGVDYNYKYGEALFTGTTFQQPNGASTRSAPSCSGTFNATTVQKNCAAGTDTASLTVSYSTPSQNTICADMTLTNASATDTLSNAMVSTLGIQMNQMSQAASKTLTVGPGNPIDFVNYGAGQWAIWFDTPQPDVTLGVTCGWSVVCKNQPQFSNLAPGQTAQARYCVRFTTDTTLTPFDLAPEAFDEYRAAYPPVVNWPDRRPVMAWWISDGGHRGASNPRGYFWQPTLNASDAATFQSTALAQASWILNAMNARPVRPQGLIIWDIEGQEFNQATSYIGDPRVFGEGYAPEMNAVADQVFKTFTDAGYRVGVTLRPEYLQWGPLAERPATCETSTTPDYNSYYIAVDQPYQQKFYSCGGSTGWVLRANGSGTQNSYQPGDDTDILALLEAKAAYAHSRWGATLFYVDSAVYVGGGPINANVFRQLQQAFPDCLFIPEQSYLDTMGAAIPYSDPGDDKSDPTFGPVTWRWAYPNGADTVALQNCQGSCWQSNSPWFSLGQKIGDIALYAQPGQMNATDLSNIESMIQDARNDMASITVTDSASGRTLSFTGSPDSQKPWPVKMRVYFGNSARQIAGSMLYCEAGSWMGTNSCALNLAGVTVTQIRYVDFAGSLVSAEPVLALP